MEHPVKLGALVRDKVTEFEGTATSCVYYVTGCTQIGVSPKVNANGETRPVEYFDHQRIEVVGPGVTMGSTDTGGPQRDAPSR